MLIEAILAASPMAICVFDKDFVVRYWNQAAEEITGWPAALAIGRLSPVELPDSEKTLALAALIQQRAQVRRFELPIRTKTGAHAVHLVSVGYAGIAGTSNDLIVCISEDITKQRRSQARLRSLLENVSEVFTLIDEDGTIQYQSGSIEKVTGYAAEQLLGRNIFEFSDDSRDELASWLRKLIDNPGSAQRLAHKITVCNGEPRWIEATGTNLLANVDVGGIVINWRDTTKERELEQALISAEKLASLGTLSSGVSHEINNPLTYLTTNLEFALREIGAGKTSLSEVVEALSEARDGAYRVRDVVWALQLFAGARDVAKGPADLNQVIRNTLCLARQEIMHKAALHEVYGEVPPVPLNEARLSQVVLNLIVNANEAVSAAEGGDHEIQIATYYSNGFVVLEVTDTGVGLPPGSDKRVFEPFFKRKAAWAGAGLGLSVCHGIVTSAGGTITAKRLEKGTAIVVTFPMAPGCAQARQARPQTAEPAGRVLIIDDELSICTALARMLSRTMEADFCLSPGEALELLAKHPYDYIVCDVAIPGMTGVDFYQQLSPSLQKRVIFITGMITESALLKAVAATGRPCVTKPFTLQAVHEAMQSLDTH